MQAAQAAALDAALAKQADALDPWPMCAPVDQAALKPSEGTQSWSV